VLQEPDGKSDVWEHAQALIDQYERDLDMATYEAVTDVGRSVMEMHCTLADMAQTVATMNVLLQALLKEWRGA